MRRLDKTKNGNFKIVCSCGRKLCDFEFTESGNIVIVCKTCLNTELIKKRESEEE